MITQKSRPSIILFLCVDNSVRSQIAEGLARQILGDRAIIQSAGLRPAGVSPLAIRVMQEIKIDISHQNSKRLDELSIEFMNGLDVIITVCEEDIFPIKPGLGLRTYKWAIPDPTGHGASPEAQIAAFRATREVLKDQIERLAVGLR